ncbi:MAG: hypothetical protein IJV41_07055 [Oscillospiraceae bacterium]|nr:hypothetical protein [Oscillospiraceae bacterium]
MKKEAGGAAPMLDAEAAHMEMVRKAAECKYNDGVICGLYQKNPEKCVRCGWNPNKGKEPTAT